MKWMQVLLHRLPAVLLLVVACLTTASVAARALFSAPLPDEYDVVRLLLGVLFCWGIAGAFDTRSHIYLDVLAGRLPPSAQAWLHRVGACLCLGMMGVVLATMARKTLETWHEGQVTIDLALPLWLFYLAACLGVLAAFLVLLKQVLKP